MATIKSYTTIEQSRKLAEILPFESADNTYERVAIAGCNLGIPEERQYVHRDIPFTFFSGIGVPCWSLAALLEQLKPEIRLENKQILFLHLNKYDDNSHEIRYTNSWTGEVLIAEADNPVDACVAMVEKLKELNLL